MTPTVTAVLLSRASNGGSVPTHLRSSDRVRAWTCPSSSLEPNSDAGEVSDGDLTDGREPCCSPRLVAPCAAPMRSATDIHQLQLGELPQPASASSPLRSTCCSQVSSG